MAAVNHAEVAASCRQRQGVSYGRVRTFDNRNHSSPFAQNTLGSLKTVRAQIAALLDLFAQHGACQSIEVLALLELRQNRVQQLFEDRMRISTNADRESD